mgnify:CR=1 FL=1
MVAHCLCSFILILNKVQVTVLVDLKYDVDAPFDMLIYLGFFESLNLENRWQMN